MVKGPAGVFSISNFRYGCVFSQGREERCIGSGGSMHGKANRAARPVRIRDGNFLLGAGGGPCHRAAEFDCVAADKLLGTVNNHLRRIDFIERKVTRVLILPLRHGLGREGVAPAQVIPVSDMLAEDDGLRAGHELGGLKPCQQSVSRWTIGAALRGKQLDKNGLAYCGHGGREKLNRCGEGQTGGEFENREGETDHPEDWGIHRKMRWFRRLNSYKPPRMQAEGVAFSAILSGMRLLFFPLDLRGLALFLCVAVAGSVQARTQPSAVTLTPALVEAGSPVLIHVDAPAAAKVDGDWMGHTLDFFQARNGPGWFALAGVDVEGTVGPSVLRIVVKPAEGASRDLSRTVEIHAAHYRTSALTVAPKFVEPGAGRAESRSRRKPS